jgi:hypothetical protein
MLSLAPTFLKQRWNEPSEPNELYDLRGIFIANVFETKMELNPKP